MIIRFDDQIALVTASSRGIGFGVAKRLFDLGARVAICGRDEASLAKAASDITGSAARLPRLFVKRGDIGEATFVTALFEETSAYFGQEPSILVNNNGGPPPRNAADATEAEWEGALARNFLSTVRLSRLAVPAMKARRFGRIVNLTSTTAKEPDAGMVLSNATRAAVSSFAKTLAGEVAPHGITVNTVLTGACLTERLKSLIGSETPTTGETLDAALARVARTIPVGFIPEPMEFASLVVYLASKEASFLTGTSIAYDGGLTRAVF